MNAILLSLLVAAGVVLLAVAVLVAVIFWIAAGEPDVNGDPERDAGLLPERRRWWRKAPPPPEEDETDFIECEVVCSRCGCHIVGPEKDIFGRETLKVSDLCVPCAREKARLVASVGEVQRA